MTSQPAIIVTQHELDQLHTFAERAVRSDRIHRAEIRRLALAHHLLRRTVAHHRDDDRQTAHVQLPRTETAGRAAHQVGSSLHPARSGQIPPETPARSCAERR